MHKETRRGEFQIGIFNMCSLHVCMRDCVNITHVIFTIMYIYHSLARTWWRQSPHTSNDLLSRRMALRTHNLPSGRLKKRLFWSRISDVSMCRKAMRNHFRHPAHRKKWLGRIRLNRLMILRTRNLPSGCFKNDFGEVDKAMFQGVERPCEFIFCILGTEKATSTNSFKWCFK
jgi:hypothetical protein